MDSQDRLRLLGEEPADFRQLEPLADALVELVANLVLQLPDLAEYRGGGKVKKFAGFSQTAGLFEHQHRAELREFHRGLSRSDSKHVATPNSSPTVRPYQTLTRYTACAPRNSP